jgi:rhodanese-related sulfurtransferase
MNVASGPIHTREPSVVGAISTRWLAERLGARWLRILDVRATSSAMRDDRSGTRLRDVDAGDEPRLVELADGAGWVREGKWPRRSRTSDVFRHAHIPGSVQLDVAGRLFDQTGSMVCAPELAMLMSQLGVGDEHTIVLVDDQPPRAALAAAWVLRRYGHEKTLLLSGGFPRWLAENRPVTSELVRHPFASFTARAE